MTPFQEFCKKNNVSADSLFCWEYAMDGASNVKLHDDDGTSMPQFKYVINGNTEWIYVDDLVPVPTVTRTVQSDIVVKDGWDYKVAENLKRLATQAVVEYNDYISRKPNTEFDKIKIEE